jgi:hypothetical protein
LVPGFHGLAAGSIGTTNTPAMSGSAKFPVLDEHLRLADIGSKLIGFVVSDHGNAWCEAGQFACQSVGFFVHSDAAQFEQRFSQLRRLAYGRKVRAWEDIERGFPPLLLG